MQTSTILTGKYELCVPNLREKFTPQFIKITHFFNKREK